MADDQVTEELCLLHQIERLSAEPEAIAHDFRRYLDHHLGRFLGCDRVYLYQALAYSVRDQIGRAHV